MIVLGVVAALCTLGVAFYVRFLVALWKEPKHSWIGYLVRLDSNQSEFSVLEPQELEAELPQAA